MPAPARILRGGRPHGWQRRVRTGTIAFVAVLALVMGSGYAYFRFQLDRLNKINIPGLADDSSTKVMNVLLVGSDSRDNVEGDIADATGKGDPGTAGSRSDTIMVLHIDPQQAKAAILSIPRDLYVPIGSGAKDKINASFSEGGPQLLIQTIKQALGIEINHYVEVDFTGVQRIVDAVGGVKVYADEPARDTMTGLDIPTKGCTELDGYQALAFVRSRYYETYENGRWVSGSNSDLDRIARQQDFIRRMMKKAVSSGLSNPLTLNRLINIAVGNVTVDRQMSSKDISTLARKFRSVDPDTVDMLTLPTTDAYSGGAAVQLLDTKKAQEFIDRLNGVTVNVGSTKPGDVVVEVLNGNGADAGASRAASGLQQAGFTVASTGDAGTYSFERTIVRYGSGNQAKAALLRDSLAAGAELEVDPSLTNGDVALVLGADYTGLRPSVAYGHADSSTTAPAHGTPPPAPPTTKSPAASC